MGSGDSTETAIPARLPTLHTPGDSTQEALVIDRCCPAFGTRVECFHIGGSDNLMLLIRR